MSVIRAHEKDTVLSPNEVRRRTRRERWRRVLLGLGAVPAILVLLSAVGLSILLLGSESAYVNWCHKRASAALSRNDHATARLCYATLVQKRPKNQDYQFGLALSLAGLGDTVPASRLIRELAPEEGVGYPGAHLYVAQSLLKPEDPRPEDLAAAESHLLRVLKAQPKTEKAHALLAAIYFKTQQWDKLKVHLPQGGPAVDEMGLMAADTFAARGDMTQAEYWARRAAGFFAPKLKANPEDEKVRLSLAQARVMCREYAAAAELIEEGWNLKPLPVYRMAMGQIYGLWLNTSATLDAPRRLGMLERGLAWNAQNGLLLQQVLSADSATAARMVVPATQPVEGAAVRALVAAVQAARANKTDKVAAELASALQFQPEILLPVTANVACVWGYSKEKDAPGAQLLSGALLKLRGDDPVAQRAHGLVLARQARYTEALPLLEAVAPSLPKDAAVHDALAIAYEKTGKAELSAQHRRLATAATQPTGAE